MNISLIVLPPTLLGTARVICDCRVRWVVDLVSWTRLPQSNALNISLSKRPCAQIRRLHYRRSVLPFRAIAHDCRGYSVPNVGVDGNPRYHAANWSRHRSRYDSRVDGERTGHREKGRCAGSSRVRESHFRTMWRMTAALQWRQAFNQRHDGRVGVTDMLAVRGSSGDGDGPSGCGAADASRGSGFDEDDRYTVINVFLNKDVYFACDWLSCLALLVRDTHPESAVSGSKAND